ncbi:hypothetical protein [Spirosoma endbachense]|uniref:Uncharacterized protein n=1 Tax=Spirosoma endbachense TaxID=2666025 RepID=A0A6P1W7N7_9BACT|nr:hypothetical protein [Spirosoma endbachense]QHW01036.1 hypothetical protein GJR95_41065 [Spirosoma endbachense]
MIFLISLFFALTKPLSVSDTEQIKRQTNSSCVTELEDSLAIQYIDLQANPLLYSEVKKYIKEQQDSSQLFKNGFGYITIGGIKLVRNGKPIEVSTLKEHEKDIEVEFLIGLSSFYPTQSMGKPLYYSFVESRLVLIYDQSVKWIHQNSYSKASVSKLKDLVKQTLMPVFDPDFEFKGFNGETVILTPERREQMSQEQILEMAAATLSKLKIVVEYFDGSISYRYVKLGKVR